MKISEGWHYRIKAAQFDLIKAAGGVERAAETSGYSKSESGRWHNRTDPTLMPINAVIALEADTGLPLVTAAMAEQSGRRLTDPDAARAAEVSIMQAHAEVLREASELANSMALAIEDGRVTPTEAQTCDRAAAKVEAVLSNMRQALAVVKAHGGEKAALRVVNDGEA